MFFIATWSSGADQQLLQLQKGKCKLTEELNNFFFGFTTTSKSDLMVPRAHQGTPNATCHRYTWSFTVHTLPGLKDRTLAEKLQTWPVVLQKCCLVWFVKSPVSCDAQVS